MVGDERYPPHPPATHLIILSSSETNTVPAPQRPRLDPAALRVICKCNKCKGKIMKTAAEQHRHILEWGRYDVGESSCAASSRRREVHTRSRRSFREMMRQRFFESSIAAVEEFGRSFRASQPACTPESPPMDDEMFRRALETLDISSLFAPVRSVPDPPPPPPSDSESDSQPMPEPEGVDSCCRGPLDEHIAHEHSPPYVGIAPMPLAMITPPHTRRGPRGSSSRRPDDSFYVDIRSRVVAGGIRLRGEAARIYREFDPTILDLPPCIPIREEVIVWGRRWIVRQSTLGASAGMGLFSCEDILFDETAPEDTRPVLFPYAGTVYQHPDWLILRETHHRGFLTYVLDVDSWRGSSMPSIGASIR
ncbi:hypothetical protein R1sor_015799 [Riccia sorocarpa]|uniref:Uncharacterized protein n=1 Tax=Riccia sorocarpa TaxID=122646 RepID=A0ABD3HD84_9MARC